jgi:hypothetical protein
MKPVENFPPAESTLKTEEQMQEFTLKAAVGQEDNMATQVLIELCNKTQRPPRYLDEIKVRYYFDISEVLENGGSVEDITVRPDYDQMKSDTDGKYVVSYEIVQYDDKGCCYLELTWPDYEFYGTLQYQFALMDTVQNAEYTFIWDPTNDYSRSKLKTAKELDVPLNVAPDYTDSLTMYVEGEKVWGVEPDGADSPEPDSDVMYGDVDCNKSVDVLDAVMLARLVAEDTETGVTDEGKLNADCKKDGKTDMNDLRQLLKYLADLIPYQTLGK